MNTPGLLLRPQGPMTAVRLLDRRIMDLTQIDTILGCLFELAESGQSLVLNFESVDFLSSAALNKLLSLDRLLRTRKQRLALCCLTPTIREVMGITRLTQVFDIYRDEDAAVEAVASAVLAGEQSDEKAQSEAAAEN